MIRLAWRNLARNRWRSGLTIGGVAVAVALLIWSQGMLEAFLVTMTESATAMQLGDLRIETAAHARESSVYDAFPASEALIDRVHRVPGVRTVAPRLLTFGLLGHGARSQGAQVLGVDAAREADASDVAKSVVSGTWLQASTEDGKQVRQVVLGQDLASLLAAKVGDDLVVMLQAVDGSLGDDRLRVVGIVRTGTSDLDRQTAWMRRDDVAYLAALEGQAHALVVRTARGADVDTVADALRKALSATTEPDLLVRTWRQLAPDLYQIIDVSRRSMLVLYLIVYLIAALGILNAQRMSALERKREFAVMMSVGVTPGQLGMLVVSEAVLLVSVGAVVGALVGWGVSAYHAYAGLDLAAFGSNGFSYGGVMFHSRLFFVVRPLMVATPAIAVLAVGALCGAWPALSSAHLKLAGAISGRS
jgi:lipoprotein-releasing system permease protein